MRILIAGAGGILGKDMIRVAIDRGLEVVATAYDLREFDDVTPHERLELKACDVTQPDQLERLCDDVDMVISCVGITRMKGRHTHMDVDYRGNLNLLRVAERAGVKKFGVVSPAGVEQGYREVPLLEARYLFEQELRKSSVAWVIFHSGGFYTDLAEMGKMAQKGSLFVIGRGDNKFTPIHVGELAEIVIADMQERSNAIVDVGGPEDMTWMDICRTLFERHKRKPTIYRTPVWLCNLCLWMLKPFSKKNYAMGKLLVFMSTIDLPTEKRGRIRLTDYLATV